MVAWPCALAVPKARAAQALASSSGSASAYFFWPRSNPPKSDWVLNVVRAQGCIFSRMARLWQISISASARLCCCNSPRPIWASLPASANCYP